ncbi:MAG TPA: Spy/CpxP family protein refolding chaperone [Xanthobacteraceae bacterium]|nr:Spy/CpxP family protein refolding chaperone [Xanthobacteraceae bacterium]
MGRIGAVVIMGALAAVALPPAPSLAFGLRIGPFHLGLPFVGFRHHAAHARRVALDRPRTSSGGALTPDVEPGLFYPAAALPGIYDEVFWPGRAPQWAFSYDAIFTDAFAKPDNDAQGHSCSAPVRTEEIVGRLSEEIRPRPDQQSLVQQLGRALGMTSAYMAKACPQSIPPSPVARLELMQSQLQALTMAIDLVRPPLQQLEQSLDAEQKTRFAAMPEHADATAACGTAPAATDWSIDAINQSVQPDQNERDALADLKGAFVSTALDLHVHCPSPLPPGPLARLEAIEGRLDASWRAALSMQVALAKFEGALNAEQRNRFETLTLAQAQ